MNRELILAVLLIISSLLHIYRSVDNYIKRHKETDKEAPVTSIPTAADAKFLRTQIRNPSWTKVYKAINAAITKGEVTFNNIEQHALHPLTESHPLACDGLQEVIVSFLEEKLAKLEKEFEEA